MAGVRVRGRPGRSGAFAHASRGGRGRRGKETRSSDAAVDLKAPRHSLKGVKSRTIWDDNRVVQRACSSLKVSPSRVSWDLVAQLPRVATKQPAVSPWAFTPSARCDCLAEEGLRGRRLVTLVSRGVGR